MSSAGSTSGYAASSWVASGRGGALDTGEATSEEWLGSLTSSGGEPTAVIDLERIAICSNPQTGSTRLASHLSTRIAARHLAVEHPGDIRWSELPDRCVLTLCWPRTEELKGRLSMHGFQVVTVRCDPLETGLSILRLAQVDRELGRLVVTTEDVVPGSTEFKVR